MDLFEIRKKAKEKEGKDAGQAQAGPQASAQAEDHGGAPALPEAKKEKKQKRKRQDAKKAPVPVAKAEEPEPVFVVENVEDAEAFSDYAPEVVPEEIPLPPVRPDRHTERPASADPAAEAEEATDEIIEYLAFRLASEEYAVKVEDVKEIIRGQSITDVPRTPGFVLGIISLRGVILPVFDIKKRLGLEGGGSKKTSRIVVIADKSGLQGIMVDKVTGVVKLKESAVEPPPAVIGGVEAEYIQGIGRIGDRLLILFNTDKVLTVG